MVMAAVKSRDRRSGGQCLRSVYEVGKHDRVAQRQCVVAAWEMNCGQLHETDGTGARANRRDTGCTISIGEGKAVSSGAWCEGQAGERQGNIARRV